MSKLVSIITASYNAEKYIAQTIASVQSQTYKNWEMLITDDASTDNTCKIVEAIAEKDSRIKLFKLNNNSGPAVARNNSIKKAKGRFLAFLDADDLWYAEKLDIQTKVMLKHKIDICFSSYKYINEEGDNLNTKVTAIKSLTYSKLLKNNYIGNLTGIYDIQKIGKIYCPLLLKRQDWCVWLGVLKKSQKPAFGIKQPLADYRVHKNSLSQNKLKLIKYNFLVYNKFLKYNLLKSVFYLSIFLHEYFLVRPKFIRNTLKDKY